MIMHGKNLHTDIHSINMNTNSLKCRGLSKFSAQSIISLLHNRKVKLLKIVLNNIVYNSGQNFNQSEQKYVQIIIYKV